MSGEIADVDSDDLDRGAHHLEKIFAALHTPIIVVTASNIAGGTVLCSEPEPVDPAGDLARCILRLANLPNFVLDRLSRYEATLWRQAGQILLFALDALSPQTTGQRVLFTNQK